MVRAARRFFTFSEYVLLEGDSGTKHEFLDGQVWAMAGGTPAHAAVSVNVGTLLSNALRGKPCRTCISDLRVRVQATGLGTYPDVTVICGPVDLDPEDPKKQTVLNPRLIVEVLSPSTEDYDRGEKLGHYKQIPSLAEVVLVAHDRQEVEIVRREADGSWSRQIAGEGDAVRLPSVGCEIPVREIYYDPVAQGP
jgi:Uma2 family endonuclease